MTSQSIIYKRKILFRENALGLFPNNIRVRAHRILRSHLPEASAYFQYSGLFVTLSAIDYRLRMSST